MAAELRPEMAGVGQGTPTMVKATRVSRERERSEVGVGFGQFDRFGPGFDPLGLTRGTVGILVILQIPLIAKIHNLSFIAKK